MREIILYSNKGKTSSDFKLKDLPGSGGRMDLNARCVISALWLSNSLRKNSKIIISLNGDPDPPTSIAFHGDKIEKISPDERNIAVWIKKALEKKGMLLDENEWYETHKGIYISRKSFQSLLEEKIKQKIPIYLLHKGGKDIKNIQFSEKAIFIVGDNHGVPEEEIRSLNNQIKNKVSIGPKEYFASQSISILHNELDRKEIH